jgi:polysaccharide chain length determinant protein (PEP-CTERM system associated)
MVQDSRTPSWLDTARPAWRRRKWLALAVFAVAFPGVLGMVVFLPNVYRANATVLVERQQVSEAFVRSAVTSEFETRLQTVSQEILSRARLGDLITRLDLYPEQRRRQPLEMVVERMRREIRLDLKAVEQTNGRGSTIAFTLGYVGKDPEAVATVTNTLASFYIEENLRVRERQALGTAEFLRGQLGAMKKRLDEQERRVADFKSRHVGELSSQVTVNLATLERLNTQLRLNNDTQIRVMERQDALAKRLADSGASSPDAGADRLARLKRELTELRTRFSDKYPDVIRVTTEIATLERALAADAARPASPPAPLPGLKDPRAALDAELRALREAETLLRAAIATYQHRLENAPTREQQLQELSRDYDTTRELYASLTKRYEEAQITESMEQRQQREQFRILDPAIAPKQPAAPNRFRLGIIGLVFSASLAGAAVLVAERLDTSFHSLDDLRRFTSVPVLARIPRIATRTDTRWRRWYFGLGTVAVMVGLLVIVLAAYYLAHDNEQFVRMLSPERS